jgi:hypothetical protein
VGIEQRHNLHSKVCSVQYGQHSVRLTAAASVQIQRAVGYTASCYLQVLLGDVFSDLPAVSNFGFSDAAEYAANPDSPFQVGRYSHTRAAQAAHSVTATQLGRAKVLKSMQQHSSPTEVAKSNTVCLAGSAFANSLAASMQSTSLCYLQHAAARVCLLVYLERQVHVRREPPKYQASRTDRAKSADEFMAETVAAVTVPCRRLFDKAAAADAAVDRKKCITEQYAALTKVRGAPSSLLSWDGHHQHADSCVLHTSSAARNERLAMFWRCSQCSY